MKLLKKLHWNFKILKIDFRISKKFKNVNLANKKTFLKQKSNIQISQK